ncbi:hypothetical protein ABH940_005538 [Streptacidiphilus sp. BW17]|uniref:plasmid mobilization protein n=1 Tax=Streptacidiphilus sp. BW17 TaxID=3156274 RepID=UPI00351585DC
MGTERTRRITSPAEPAAPPRKQRRRPRASLHLDDQLNVRVRKADRDEIDAAAKKHGWTMSKFVTNAALNAARGETSAYDPQDRLNRAVDELVHSREQLARVGRNLNQVARALNAGGYPEPAELTTVIASVARAVGRVEECAAVLVRE